MVATHGDAKLILDRLSTVSDEGDLIELLLEAGALAHRMQIDAFLHVPCSGRYSGDEDVSGCATEAKKAADFLDEVRAVAVDILQGVRNNDEQEVDNSKPLIVRVASWHRDQAARRKAEKDNG